MLLVAMILDSATPNRNIESKPASLSTQRHKSIGSLSCNCFWPGVNGFGEHFT